MEKNCFSCLFLLLLLFCGTRITLAHLVFVPMFTLYTFCPYEIMVHSYLGGNWVMKRRSVFGISMVVECVPVHSLN